MHAVHLTADRRDEWDRFVAQDKFFAHLQSWEWGEFKALLGWQPARLGVEHEGRLVAGAQLLIKIIPLGLASFVYVPRGPLVDWSNQPVTTCLLEAIHQVARQQRAIFLRLEPPLEDSPATHAWLQHYGFQPHPHTNQPRCTLIVDLTPGPEELFNRLSKSTRKKVRAAQNKGVQIRTGHENDLDTFLRIMESTGKRADFPIRSRKYYTHEFQLFLQAGRARLALATYQGVDVAVDMTFTFGRQAASFHGGFVSEFPHLKINHALVWDTICWAHQQGCHSFDLWGIPSEIGELAATGQPLPENRYDGLWGVYHFKRAFSQQIVYYVGAYDYVYNPLLYRATTLAAARFGSLDQVAKLADRLF